jgi:hypothetical protein
MEEKIIHAAASLAFNDHSRNSDAVSHDDYVSVGVDVDGVGPITVKIFWSELFRRIRDKFHISPGEIRAELQAGPMIKSDLAGDYDEDCFFSNRERLVVKCLHGDELANFREFFNEFGNYELAQDDTFLPAHIAFFQIETRAKIKTKSAFFVISKSIFPRQNHDYMFFFDLKGCATRQGDGGFLKDADLTWEHEMSFPSQERGNVLRALQSDVHFLRGLNLTNYSLVVVITQRHVSTTLQLPGQPYGPDADDESDDRKKTLPLRHDVADGAKAIRADLIPKPRFVDEHPEW